ncbi:MAG: low molecular weight phosphotyrosine protein phosphatase [Clostridia bacterium]|nr:low molecular weight phosphotyrosine protein phosphatase [Clostridia bacterium]
MIRILFVCHGNICRSPMCEFVMKAMAEKENLSDKIFAASAATSLEAIGCDIHRGTQKVLTEHGIPFESRAAVRLEKSDLPKYDYFIGMDSANISNMKKILGDSRKIHRLLEFAELGRDISDPWYTHDFNRTYEDVTLGCAALMSEIKKKLRQQNSF